MIAAGGFGLLGVTLQNIGRGNQYRSRGFVLCVWLEIRGRIETRMRMLPPFTMYKAYLVYKISGCPLGLHRPVVVTVGTKAYGFDYECPGLKETMEGSDSKHTVV